jgi:uncharacterized protein
VSLEELNGLLELQARDTTLDQLRHRRASLPERARLEACTADLRTKSAQRAEVTVRRDAARTEERRIDDEARSIGEHVAAADKKLYSGNVTSPRELQAMQADLDMLKRQVSELEDQELEIMERREALDNDVAGFDTVIAALEQSAAEMRATIASAEAEIDAEIAQEGAARAGLAAKVGPTLLADYERRRAQNKGGGAARLVGTTCQACHLTIPSTEAEKIRRNAGDSVSYCDNCGAILVP